MRKQATHGFHAIITARPGMGDELIAVLLGGVPANNENCVLYLVGRSASNPDVVHVSEGWTTKAAHAENFATDRSKAILAKLATLMANSPRYFDEVPVDGMFSV